MRIIAQRFSAPQAPSYSTPHMVLGVFLLPPRIREAHTAMFTQTKHVPRRRAKARTVSGYSHPSKGFYYSPPDSVSLYSVESKYFSTASTATTPYGSFCLILACKCGYGVKTHAFKREQSAKRKKKVIKRRDYRIVYFKSSPSELSPRTNL